MYYLKHSWWAVCCVFILAACGGERNSSGSDSHQLSNDITADRPLQNVSTSAIELVSPEPEATENEIKVATYNRGVDYPNFVVEGPFYIPTTSGNNIGIRVTYPADENKIPVKGPFPVILVQSGYNTGHVSFVQLPGGAMVGMPDPFFVQRGYIMVTVDIIGTGISQGGWELIGAEEQSGYGDVVDWIQAQPWSDGNIGVAGASYMAITSLFTAQQRPDDIKAIFAAVPLGDAQRGTVGAGGLINGLFMSVWLNITHFTATQNIPNMIRDLDLMSQMIAATDEHVKQIEEYYLPLIDDAIAGDPKLAFDSEFWRTRSTLENIDKIQAPTMLLGSVHDIFQRDAPLLYASLKDRVDTRLMMFGGNHITNFFQAIPGTNKSSGLVYVMLQWFDKYLKGLDTNTESIPPVTQYVKNYGSGPWQGFITTTDWPHPASEPERWYLRGDDQLSKALPGENERNKTMAAAEFANYEYGKHGAQLVFNVEPNDGTKCSLGYEQWTLGIASIFEPKKCYRDHEMLQRTALNYDSAPMGQDYFISGPLQADLWISSTTTDAVVAVRVDEVTASGRVNPLTNGLLLASARAVDESRSEYVLGEMVRPYHYLTESEQQILEPNEVVKMQVEIFPTSAIIRKGSRLRVSISPSNQVQGILNQKQRERVEGGVTTIYNSPEYPSSLMVLKVPLEELN